MIVHVRLFAGLREQAGFSERDIEIDDGATCSAVAQAIDELAKPLPDGLAFAVNRAYAEPTHVLADGDIHTSGDLAKAIACGADAVVLGTPLASAAEAPGGGWFWPAAAAHPSLPRGALLQVADGERPSLEQVLTGPSDDPFGSLNLVGGLGRSMAKSGYCDLKEFQKVGLTVGS